jgi:hypothetical protein
MRHITRLQPSSVANAEFRYRLARISGLLYLTVAILGMFASTALETFAVPGDAAATAATLQNSVGLFGLSLVAWLILLAADATLAVTLYLILEPVGRALSLGMAVLRLTYVAIVASSLINLVNAFVVLSGPAGDAQGVGLSALDAFTTHFALILFGLHLSLLGLLLYRSRYVPRVLSLSLMVGGATYVVHSLGGFFAADTVVASTAIVVPAALAELAFTAWLLLRGIDVRQAPALSHAPTELASTLGDLR